MLLLKAAAWSIFIQLLFGQTNPVTSVLLLSCQTQLQCAAASGQRKGDCLKHSRVLRIGGGGAGCRTLGIWLERASGGGPSGVAGGRMITG